MLKRGQTSLLDSHLETCQEDAATKVQAAMRGYLANKKEGSMIKEKLSGVLKMQSAVRAFLARRRTGELATEKAQAAQQLRLAREMQEEYDRATRQDDASVSVQRVWRGFKGRERATQKLQAITRIQSAWRRSDTSARISYLRSKYIMLVVHVQRAVRGFLARTQAKRDAIANQAACIIQEAYLRHLARRHTAAAQLQAWWRKIWQIWRSTGCCVNSEGLYLSLSLRTAV